jgi:hypothetical protein
MGSKSTLAGRAPIILQLMRRHTVCPTDEAARITFVKSSNLGDAPEKCAGPNRHDGQRERAKWKPTKAN